MAARTIVGADGKTRCWWCGVSPDYVTYHDTEWGFPVTDDRRLFEKLCLESFQSGLSWRTILTKRENFRVAFRGFDIEQVAEFTEQDVARLLGDAGIVRHRTKITSVINNARMARRLIDEHGSLAAYAWGYEPDVHAGPGPAVASTSAESVAMAKDLKKRGWKFLGPTTVYAFMQAMGLVNDHLVGCTTGAEVERARADFIRPTA